MLFLVNNHAIVFNSDVPFSESHILQYPDEGRQCLLQILDKVMNIFLTLFGQPCFFSFILRKDGQKWPILGLNFTMLKASKE